MSFFEVSDLSLAFGGVRALDGVGFSVERGQVFAIIGPNGAGKTTILNVVTRVFTPAAGRVVLDGLAGAVGADDGEHQAALDRKVDAIERAHPAKGERQVANLEEAHL